MDAPMDRFLRSLASQGMADQTIRYYALWVGRWQCHLAGMGKEIFDTDIDDAEDYVLMLRRQFGPEYVRAAISKLRGFYDWACRRRMTATNPFSVMRSRQSQPIRIPKGVPSEQEVSAMLDAFQPPKKMADLRDWAVIHTLYGAALRRGELINLNLDDVLWDQSQLFIRTSKTGAQGLVPIHERGLEAIRTYLDIVRPLYARRNGKHESALFLGPRGKRISGDMVASSVDRAAEKAGIERHIHPHLLRHAALTHMRSHGADLRIVQEFARHKSIAATQIYLHLSKAELQSEYRRYHPAAKV